MTRKEILPTAKANSKHNPTPGQIKCLFTVKPQIKGLFTSVSFTQYITSAFNKKLQDMQQGKTQNLKRQ